MTIELAEQDVATRLASPWQPMPDKTDLKHLGKLLEELGELTSAVSRCLIQGIDEVQPVTGKSNRLWLEEEYADVYAGMLLVARRFGLRADFVHQRMDEKVAYLKNWHEMV